MLVDNMDFNDLNKLNYCGTGILLTPYIFTQFMSEDEKERFMEDYNNTIVSILSSCAGVDKILGEFIDLNEKHGYVDIKQGEDSSYCFINYGSLMTAILAYISTGKNLEQYTSKYHFDGRYENQEYDNYVYEVAREHIRTIRKQLQDILDSGNLDIRQINKDYPAIANMVACSKNAKKMKTNNGKTIIEINDLLEEGIECLTQLIFANKNMNAATLRHVIDLNKYHIDKDRYLFYLFSYHMNAVTAWDKSDLIDKNIYPILSYYKEVINTDTSKLFYYNVDGKKHTFDEFVRKLQEYVKTHREINCDILPFDYFKGWSSEEVDEFLNIFTEETLSNFKEIDPEVLFLPNSKGISKMEKKNKDTIKKEIAFSLLPLEKREFYSKNRDKIYMSLLGEKKFKGYILNVLNNGYVIFEKYDTKEGDISSKSAAAYIMNIFNFKSLYEMSPSAIRSFIKSQDKSKPLFDRIDYKCHMGKWQEHLQKYFDEDTKITPSDVEEVLALEKVKVIEYTKKKEEE